MPGSGRSRGLGNQCTRRASRRRHSPRAGGARGGWGTRRRLRSEVPTLCPEGLAAPVTRTPAAWDHEDGLGAARSDRSTTEAGRLLGGGPMAPEGPSPRRSRRHTAARPCPGTAAPGLWMPGASRLTLLAPLRVDARQVGPARSVSGGEAGSGQCPPATARKASGVTPGRPRPPGHLQARSSPGTRWGGASRSC